MQFIHYSIIISMVYTSGSMIEPCVYCINNFEILF